MASQSGATATCTFGYTGGAQTWSVPAGVTSATFDVQGAQGGNVNRGFTFGGLGGEATGNVALTPGATVALFVGGQGGGNICRSAAIPSAGGFNGGGEGTPDFSNCPGGGGGGASDVRIGGSDLSDRVLVAGGGGGGAPAAFACRANGGGGGGLTGGAGTDFNCNSVASGGDQTGASGSMQLGVGSDSSPGGGGGGGGYYGGAGGGGGVGGGGGSGFGPAGTTFQTGVHSGDGVITVSFPCGANCQGQLTNNQGQSQNNHK